MRPGQSVLVAVSGGLDSMVLLHLLHALSVKQRWKLTVAHLNHHLRGASSQADQRLVVRVARRLRLPIVVGHADVKALARDRKISIEMAARQARHAFFAETARKAGIRTIALAHHADDQVELFFIRLLRGTGTEALAGMKSSSPSPVDRKIRLVRPLLALPKAALARYAKENRIKFREDATNAQFDMPRNRIRHQLLPLLRRHYQPALTQNILRLMQIIGAESDVISRAADVFVKKLRSPTKSGKDGAANKRDEGFADLPIAIQRRCIHLQLLELGVLADFDLVEKLRLSPTIAVNVAEISPDSRKTGETQKRKNLFVLRDPDGKIIRRAVSPETTFKSDSAELTLRSDGQLVFSGLTLKWKVEGRKGALIRGKAAGIEVFDADRVGERVIVRHWHPGDRFQPIGMASATKVQDFFVNQKVPREMRRKLALATAENGDIFWIEGMRISERFKVTERTTRRLHWQWRRA